MSQHTSERQVKIADIKSGMRALNVFGKILSISEIRNVSTKFGPATIATARLQDESGEIRLNLWRGQISAVKSGDIVRLENAFVKVFNNQNELNLGKDGRIIILS